MSKYLVNRKNNKIFNGVIPRYSGTILWVNSNPNNSFGQQAISLKNNNYDELILYAISDVNIKNSIIIRINKNESGRFTLMSGGSLRYWIREVNYVNETTYSIQDCKLIHSSGSEIVNTQIIPQKIIGIKH